MTREEAIRALAHLIAGSAPGFPKMCEADQDRSTVNVTLWLRAAITAPDTITNPSVPMRGGSETDGASGRTRQSTSCTPGHTGPGSPLSGAITHRITELMAACRCGYQRAHDERERLESAIAEIVAERDAFKEVLDGVTVDCHRFLRERDALKARIDKPDYTAAEKELTRQVKELGRDLNAHTKEGSGPSWYEFNSRAIVDAALGKGEDKP